MKTTIHTAAGAAALALLAACSSTPVATADSTPAAAAATPSKPAPAPAATSAPTAQSQVTTVTVPAYLDPNSPISRERSVYFGFDDFSIKDDYRSLIERQGRFLASHPDVAVKVEGNSDERGGTEYNLALGQKRAEAVARALRTYGVQERQLEPISWGEGKPKAPGHDESAWAQNRRADLHYPPQ
jgi:peptidoglycan-associated lipoprotein